MEQQVHEIVIVGGGAGGLELATRLRRQVGEKEACEHHADRRLALAPVETAAVRSRGRQPRLLRRAAGVPGAGTLARFHLPPRPHGRPRPQAPGSQRRAHAGRERHRDHPAPQLSLRHADHRGRLGRQRLRRAGRKGALHHARHPRAGARVPSPPHQRLPARAIPRPRPSRPASSPSASSAPAPPASNSPPNCTTPRASCRTTAWTTSNPKRA